jgi:hypothetical protein
MEGALLDWMDQTGGSMRQALDQFGIQEQGMRNTILARNIERTTGIQKGGAYQYAQAAEEAPPGQAPGYQPMMGPQEFGQHALTEARQEARALPGGVAQNLPQVAPAPQIQRQAMQQEAETTGLPPEPATRFAYAERPDLAPPPTKPKGTAVQPWLMPQQPGTQMQAAYQGIPGGAGGRLGRYLGEYEGLSEEMRGAIERGGKGLTEAIEGQEEALRRERNLAQQQATQEAMLGRERIQQWETMQTEQAQKEQMRQQRLDTDMQKLRTTLDDIQKSKIDPSRFYKKPDGTRDYGKTILAGVAVALGALGEQMQGRGGNPALDIIQRSIDRDIEAQRADLANRRAGVGLEMNLLGQMRAQFADERQAETAARIAMLDTYEMKLSQVAAQSKSELIQRRYEKQMADIGVQKAKLQSDFEQSSLQQAMQETQAAFGMEATRQQLGMQRLGMAAKMAGGGAPPRMGGYVPYRSTSEAEQKEARKVMGGKGRAVTALEHMISLRRQFKSELWPAYVSENAATLKTIGRDLMLKLKDYYDMGALQEHEMEMMREMVPDPTSWGNVLPQLNSLLEVAKRDLDFEMDLRGYSPGAPRTIEGEQAEPQR